MVNQKMVLIGVLTLFMFFQASPVITQELQTSEMSEDSVEVTATAANLVKNISIDPDTPNILAFGEKFTVTFDYVTNETGGVRIWVRPKTGKSLTPQYAACGSPLYAAPAGSGSCDMTITSGNVTVDGIRIQMWTKGQTQLLFSTTLPVHYKFR